MVDFFCEGSGMDEFFDEDGDGRLFHEDGGMYDDFFHEGAG